jgi:hypothetical protein
MSLIFNQTLFTQFDGGVHVNSTVKLGEQSLAKDERNELHRQTG